jgi:hypothetical protein
MPKTALVPRSIDKYGYIGYNRYINSQQGDSNG